MAEEVVPHVLLFPFPIQGHVPPMLMLAELLHEVAKFHITFVNTEYIHHRLLTNSPEAVERLGQRPRFRFRTISDGLPKDEQRLFIDFLDLEESMRRRSREAYRHVLLEGGLGEGWPPVTCVVADGILPLALEVAEEVQIPVVIFRACSACSFWVYCCIPNLLQRGELPFPENADIDKLIQGVPGTETFLRRRDLPSFCRHAKCINDRALQFQIIVASNAKRARALILNTFDSLESPTLSHIRSHLSHLTYSIGPLHLLSRTFHARETSANLASLWQEEKDCVKWLDTQPPKSVIYVSFGSITVVSKTEFLELWNGVINSGRRFLWVMRPGLVDVANMEMSENIPEVGYVVKWAPQEEVLAHPAVGCFLTHGGWNSTVESIVAGVPMICWPFFADQQTNSRFVNKVWKMGVDMKDICKRRVVEEMVREVMEEGGEEVRRATIDMAGEARKSTTKGGSSYAQFLRLIQQIRDLSWRRVN